jgi:hypothetical protein
VHRIAPGLKQKKLSILKLAERRRATIWVVPENGHKADSCATYVNAIFAN